MRSGYFLLEMTVAIILIMALGWALTHFVPSLSAPTAANPVTEPSTTPEPPIEPQVNAEPIVAEPAPACEPTSITLPNTTIAESYTVGLSTYMEDKMSAGYDEYCFEQGNLNADFFLTGAIFSNDCTATDSEWTTDDIFTMTSFNVGGDSKQIFQGYARKDADLCRYDFTLNVAE